MESILDQPLGIRDIRKMPKCIPEKDATLLFKRHCAKGTFTLRELAHVEITCWNWTVWCFVHLLYNMDPALAKRLSDRLCGESILHHDPVLAIFGWYRLSDAREAATNLVKEIEKTLSL